MSNDPFEPVKCYKCGSSARALKRVSPIGVSPAAWVCWDCNVEAKGDKELFKGMDEKAASLFQLNEWVEGRSHHNPISDECCPDFSCCRPEALIDREQREQFRDAYLSGDDYAYMTLLTGMLVNAFKTLNIPVIGVDHGREN